MRPVPPRRVSILPFCHDFAVHYCRTDYGNGPCYVLSVHNRARETLSPEQSPCQTAHAVAAPFAQAGLCLWA